MNKIRITPSVNDTAEKNKKISNKKAAPNIFWR